MYGSFAFVGGYQWVFQLLRAIGAPAHPPPVCSMASWSSHRQAARPLLFHPQAQTVPSALSAKQWAELAAIAFMPGKSPTFAFTCTGVALFLIAALLPS